MIHIRVDKMFLRKHILWNLNEVILIVYIFFFVFVETYCGFQRGYGVGMGYVHVLYLMVTEQGWELYYVKL